MPIWISKWLKESFLKDYKLSDENNPKNIYIDRSDEKSNLKIQRAYIIVNF